MCWRCVSDSVPYVMGSLVAVRIYGARLGKAARRELDEAVASDEPSATTPPPGELDRASS
jgi:hypothetical protein